MKIKVIEYENFRNFKNKGKVEFSTDGKVTIIYGFNGAGKTTFHQLFQWIMYGKVKFNKTTTNKLYNLDLEKNSIVNSQFSVFGSIDFEHENEIYSIRREWKYKKTLFDVSLLKQEFSISKKCPNADWKRINNPEEFVEQILPSGLADYFFFDGESMISDLKVKGRDSAKNLKKALYLILGLNIYDKACKVIGDEDQTTSVLGNLTLSKTGSGTGAELETLGLKYQSALEKRDSLQANLDEINRQIKEKQEKINELSEKIGEAKSQKEYNEMRIHHKKTRDNYLSLVEQQYHLFGDTIIDTFPKFFLSTAIQRASKVIETQSNMQKIIPGVDVPLIDALLKEDTCICGNKITQKEIETLSKLYKQLPPYGYASLYNNFTMTANNWGKEYSRNKVEKHIETVTNLISLAQKEEMAIAEIDEKMKDDKKYEKFVTERIEAEQEIDDLNVHLSRCSGELAKAKIIVSNTYKEIQRLSSTLEINKTIDLKISIMKEVKKYFETLLVEKSIIYSDKLQNTIQKLLDEMLEAKRNVEVNSDFGLKVFDSFGDESKSEGQFATVSFAYIGGIFKVLKTEELLSNKEYPLVLDAPFSKLDNETRSKVAKVLPNYAPQIIIFSKDDLRNEFEEDKIGSVYTIISNDEQNVAEVKEGFFLWK